MLLGSFIDSASIPIPIDVLMGMWAWNDRQHFYLYALLAALGSSLGGLIPFFVGRAGGELFLLKRVNRARFEAMRNQFEKQEFLAVMVPSLLPPPTPWKLFVFGAGVFEMRTLNFMLAVFVGRCIRFGVETALVVKYGPQIVTVVGGSGEEASGADAGGAGGDLWRAGVVDLAEAADEAAGRREPGAVVQQGLRGCLRSGTQ